MCLGIVEGKRIPPSKQRGDAGRMNNLTVFMHCMKIEV